MDIKAYISSGILEQYAFDLLSPSERSEVEANLQQYPELVAELRQVEYAIEKYLSLYQDKITPEFYPKLNDRLENIKPDPLAATPAVGVGGTRNPVNGWLTALVLLALTAAAWLFYQNQQKDNAYATLQQEYNTLKEECDQTDDVNRGLLIELQTIRQSGNSLIQMRGTDKAPEAIASIFYNSESQKTYLDVINLPAPPSDKQYQLWAIVDGTPVDMGVFDVVIDSTGLQEVPFIDNPQAFAVTLEPRGGSEVPTLEDMVVIGTTG